PPALKRSAEYPVDRAVSMVGAARAVLAERTTEFREDDDHRAAPGRAHLAGERRESLPEAREEVRELALRVALVHVRVPAADVDEREMECVLHEARHPPGLQLECGAGRGVAVL